MPIITDSVAFPSGSTAAAATPSPGVKRFTFQYEQIFITATTSNTIICISPSPQWQQPISSLLLRTGTSDAHEASLTARHGTNQFVVDIPAFFELAKEHARAPFFVFQMMCCALWSFEDNFIYRFFVYFCSCLGV